MAAKFKKGDRVIVVAGEERKRGGGAARTGQILKVYPDEDRVLIQGVNMVKRHTKQSARSQGGIVTKEAPVHISNIAHIDPKTGGPTRIGFKTLQDGRKVRFAKKSGEVIDV
jgi:large subunit ribosomal protein L24